MKRISKLLLSFCMLFILSFSLVACMGGEEKPDNKPAGYTPPKNVDMTSETQYAEWLLEHHTTSASYEMKYYLSKNTNVTESGSLKYLKNNNILTSASYDSTGTLTHYYEFTNPADNQYIVTIYNTTSKTYASKNYNSDEFTTFKSDLFYVDSVIQHYLFDYEKWNTTEATVSTQKRIVKDDKVAETI